MAGADLRVAARQGHVERSRDALDARQLVDAERLPHRVHPAVRREERLEAGRGQAEDLHVVVPDHQAEEAVSHRPADEVRPPSRHAHGSEQAHQSGRQLQIHASRAYSNDTASSGDSVRNG